MIVLEQPVVPAIGAVPPTEASGRAAIVGTASGRAVIVRMGIVPGVALLVVIVPAMTAPVVIVRVVTGLRVTGLEAVLRMGIGRGMIVRVGIVLRVIALGALLLVGIEPAAIVPMGIVLGAALRVVIVRTGTVLETSGRGTTVRATTGLALRRFPKRSPRATSQLPRATSSRH